MLITEREVRRFSKVIEKAIQKNDFNGAVAALELCAELRYRDNQIVYDSSLEKYLLQLVQKIEVYNKQTLFYNKKVVLFYDGFGLDYRGLSYIYVKALTSLGNKVILVLDERHTINAEKMVALVKKKRGEVYCLQSQSYADWCKEFAKIILKYEPAHAFLYSSPYDVGAMLVFQYFRNRMCTFLINSTDQEYWLGINATDYIIEFRDFGASISAEYRGIDRKRLIKLPFYPYVDKQKKFEGYPFAYRKEMVVIFSGGQLYKTEDKNRTYYKIVQSVLEKHSNVIFWYARGGKSSELEVLQSKFPGRVFHTKERSDLLQVLQHCDIYLNTYPIAGGLMMQYSALAGKLPVGLRTVAGEADDILIEQEEHRVFFNSMDALIEELDKLITDLEYRQRRNKEVRKGTVISEDEFTVQVKKMIENHRTDFSICFKHYPIRELIEVYNKINRGVNSKIFFKCSRKYLLKYEPYVIVRNNIDYIISKIKQKAGIR